MSDYTPFPNENYPDTSSEANAVGNYLYSIVSGTHPAIVAGEKAYQKALCDTGYFCCGPCDCNYREDYFMCYDTVGGGPAYRSDPESCTGGGFYATNFNDPNCKPWWSPWWDIPPCGVDPIAKAKDDALRPINKAYEEATGREARIKLAGNRALSLSNERLSGIFYNSMLKSTESILIGMANTFLQAGAIAGAIAGASQVFANTMGQYAFQANAFLQSFEPYNPPPIGGGGMGGGLS